MKLVYQLLFLILHILACSTGRALGCNSKSGSSARSGSRTCKNHCTKAEAVNQASKSQSFSDEAGPAKRSSSPCIHLPHKNPMVNVKVIKNQARDGSNRKGPL